MHRARPRSCGDGAEVGKTRRPARREADGRVRVVPGAETDEAVALFVLMSLKGVGSAALRVLLQRYGSARAAMAAPWKELRRIGLPRNRLLPGPDQRNAADLRAAAERTLTRAARSKIAILPWGGDGYPDSVAKIPDPPGALFLLGDAQLLERPGIAIVGSRRATERGREFAYRLASRIAARGRSVVSGLALGIDAAAHRGALAVGGPTLAVLGCGADIVYPRSNRGVYRDILAKGLIVSEFAPGVRAAPYHFPQRNRVISALADVVVVVEAGERSGVRHTVDHALDQGKDVHAVRGGGPSSPGNEILLEEGAQPLDSIADFVDRVCARMPPPKQPTDLAPEQAEMLGRLSGEPATIDSLVASSGLSAKRTLAALTALEIAGWAEQCSGARFRAMPSGTSVGAPGRQTRTSKLPDETPSPRRLAR